MAAFERVLSGIPEMDHALDNIRLGDNVVMGLGTGAVDRIQGSYPRLVNLDRPRMTTAVTCREKHQFSQRRIDVIDTVKRVLEGKELSWIEGKLPFYLKRVLMEHDRDAETDFRNRGAGSGNPFCILRRSCQK